MSNRKTVKSSKTYKYWGGFWVCIKSYSVEKEGGGNEEVLIGAGLNTFCGTAGWIWGNGCTCCTGWDTGNTWDNDCTFCCGSEGRCCAFGARTFGWKVVPILASDPIVVKLLGVWSAFYNLFLRINISKFLILFIFKININPLMRSTLYLILFDENYYNDLY